MVLETLKKGKDLLHQKGMDLLHQQRQLLSKLKDEIRKPAHSPEKSDNIPQELKIYRQQWDKEISGISDSKKAAIKKRVEEIPHTVKKESDGSMLIEFKIGIRKIRLLNTVLNKHTDSNYRVTDNIEGVKSHELQTAVKLGGMRGSIDQRENKELKAYVKQKQKEGFQIAKRDEIYKLLVRLGNGTYPSGVDEDQGAQIAMLMYLTGMNGSYCLDDGEQVDGSCIDAKFGHRDLARVRMASDNNPARLLMMSIE